MSFHKNILDYILRNVLEVPILKTGATCPENAFKHSVGILILLVINELRAHKYLIELSFKVMCYVGWNYIIHWVSLNRPATGVDINQNGVQQRYGSRSLTLKFPWWGWKGTLAVDIMFVICEVGMFCEMVISWYDLPHRIRHCPY